MRGTERAARRSGAACCAVVAAAALLLAACGGAASRLASHLQRGQAYFDQGDYTHASVEFRNAMQIAPTDLGARLLMARTAEKLGQVRQAAGLYESVIEGAADQPQARAFQLEARASLGRLLVLAGQTERALKTVAPALVDHPDDPLLLTVRASARMQSNDLSGAAADIDHALKVAPLDENALAVRAALYRRAGDPQQAIVLLSHAVQQLPNGADLRDVLVELYLAAGEPDQAEEQLQVLIRLKPQSLRYRTALAHYYASAGKPDEAERVLEAAVSALPQSNDAKLTLLDFLVSQRSPEQAEKTLRGFIAREPDNYDMRLALGALLQGKGATQQALDTYAAVVERDGTGPSGLLARDQMAAIAAAQGRSADAHKLIDEVLQKNAHDTEALTLRGEMALSRGDATAAIADLRAVLREQPKAVALYQLLARAHLVNNEPTLAEQALHGALDVDPGNVGVSLQLAELLALTQRSDEALSLLEDTVRKAPRDPQAREALTHAYLGKRDFAAARRSAADLQTLQPDAAVGFYLAGLADEGAGHLDDARKELEHALAQKPAAFDVLTALVRLDLARHEDAQAIALLQGVTQRDPQNAALVNLLGETYLGDRNIAKASEAFARAMTLAPNWWVPYHNQAVARLAAGDSAGAIAAYSSGMRVDPTETKLVTDLAGLYVREDRVEDAISSYETFYGRHPSPIVARNLAMLLVTYHTDRRSLDRARDLVNGFTASNDGSLLDATGWVHFKRAEYADALPVLQRASERSPDSKEIRYHLGMAELQTGHNDRARSDLETAVSGATGASWADAARTALASLKSG